MIMDELLKKIYENVIAYEPEAIKCNKNLNNQISELIEPYKNQFSENDIEIIENLMYSVMLFSEHEGFQIGTKYTMKMLFNLLLDL